jgi:hypothetical protein
MSSIPENTLVDKWSLTYHLPANNNWDISSYIVIMGDIDTAQKVIAINEVLHDNIIKNCMLFIMRSGIDPMWEHPKNSKGGCFSYKVINKQVPNVWRTLTYLLCGESLAVEQKYNQYINGITISPKKNFCIIKIWLSTIEFQDPNIIVHVPNLSKQGCIFKKHEPEF